jgi:hypothetical protein
VEVNRPEELVEASSGRKKAWLSVAVSPASESWTEPQPLVTRKGQTLDKGVQRIHEKAAKLVGA